MTTGETAPALPRTSLVTGPFVRVMLANFGYFLSLGTINPVLGPFVRGPLGGSDVAVGVALASFTVTALVLRPFSGRLGDRRGRHLPILAGLIIHAVAMLGLILASSLVHVVVLRLVTGIGEALFFVGASTAAQDLAPDHRRGEAASYFSLSLFAGLGVGPWLGEWLVDIHGYRAAFAAAAAAATFGAIVATTVRDTRADDESPGFGKLIHPASLRPGAILGCAIWGLAAFQGFVPLYARFDLGMSGARTALLANTLTIFLFRSVGAKLPDRLGPRLAARISLVCTPAALAIIGLWAEPTGLYIGAVLLGVGQSMAFPALMTIAVNNAPASERGAVMGTFTAFFDLSFGMGSLVLGFVAHAAGYSAVFLTATGVASIGFLQMMLAPPTIKSRTTDSQPQDVVAVEPTRE